MRASHLVYHFLNIHSELRESSRKRYQSILNTFFKTCYKSGTPLSMILSEYRCNFESTTERCLIDRLLKYVKEQSINDVENDFIRAGETEFKQMISWFGEFYKHKKGLKNSDHYEAMLLSFARQIDFKYESFNISAAERLMFKRDRAKQTKQSYRSGLRAFCWSAIQMIELPEQSLTHEEKKVRALLSLIPEVTYRDVLSLKTPVSARTRVSQVSGQQRLDKDTLTEQEREIILADLKDVKLRLIFILMAWNGLRLPEALNLRNGDFNFGENKISVMQEQRKTKEDVYLMPMVKDEARRYISSCKAIYTDEDFALFLGLDHSYVSHYFFRQLGQFKKIGKKHLHGYLGVESIRLTAGQLLYNKGVRLEYIQKTLRCCTMKELFKFSESTEQSTYFVEMDKIFNYPGSSTMEGDQEAPLPLHLNFN